MPGRSGPYIKGTSAATLAWVARVVANGGASPSAGTITKADTWYKALVAASIDTLIKELSFFAPDSLIAALTPFFVTRSANLWTVSGTGGSISAAGLNTGVGDLISVGGLVANYFTTATAGMSWCGQIATGTAASAQCGFGTALTSALFFYTNTAQAFTNAGLITWTDPFPANTNGFISINRTGVNQLDFYRGNGTVAFASGGTNASASGTVPVSGVLKCGSQAGNPFYYNFSATYNTSILSAHLGMSLAQCQAFFNANKTLRQAFGGGI